EGNRPVPRRDAPQDRGEMGARARAPLPAQWAKRTVRAWRRPSVDGSTAKGLMMPKLPRGMFLRKGRGYYTRRWANGKDCWIALGKDFDEACRKLRTAERSEIPVVRLR